MERYKVRVTKDYLTFCAAHFISFEGTQCERLHGHNYKVAAEIEGRLNEDHLVFDFIVLKGLLRDIANELDHRMLVPTRSTVLRIEHDERTVRLAYGRKEWTLPREDCVLLPIENTTAELLAKWIHGRLGAEIRAHTARLSPAPPAPDLLSVEVEESHGQCATYTAGA